MMVYTRASTVTLWYVPYIPYAVQPLDVEVELIEPASYDCILHAIYVDIYQCILHGPVPTV
jgi:hypothetical protein